MRACRCAILLLVVAGCGPAERGQGDFVTKNEEKSIEEIRFEGAREVQFSSKVNDRGFLISVTATPDYDKQDYWIIVKLTNAGEEDVPTYSMGPFSSVWIDSDELDIPAAHLYLKIGESSFPDLKSGESRYLGFALSEFVQLNGQSGDGVFPCKIRYDDGRVIERANYGVGVVVSEPFGVVIEDGQVVGLVVRGE